jgi:hypothetical protein
VFEKGTKEFEYAKSHSYLSIDPQLGTAFTVKTMFSSSSNEVAPDEAIKDKIFGEVSCTTIGVVL